MFVQFLLFIIFRLAILVFDVPMLCQRYYCFEILALSYD